MNCDDLDAERQQLERDKQRVMEEMARLDRVAERLGQVRGATTGEQATNVFQDLMGDTLDNTMAQEANQRALDMDARPVGADGQFINYAQAKLTADINGTDPANLTLHVKSLLTAYEKADPADWAYVVKSFTPEDWAGWAMEAGKDSELSYPKMLAAAQANALPFSLINENGTRLRVMADISVNAFMQHIDGAIGIIEETGLPLSREYGAELLNSYKRAKILQRYWVMAKRRTGQFLRSLQNYIETPEIARGAMPSVDDVFDPKAMPGDGTGTGADGTGTDGTGTGPQGGVGTNPNDINIDSVIGRILDAIHRGKDGLPDIRQIKIALTVDGIDPTGSIERDWSKVTYRLQRGLFKDSQLFNSNTLFLKSIVANRSRGIEGVVRTAIENGPMEAPLGTRAFTTAFANRLSGLQTAWEAMQAVRHAIKISNSNMFWRSLKTGQTPFANESALHGLGLTPKEQVQALRMIVQEPFSDEPMEFARQVIDKNHAASRLFFNYALHKTPGVDNILARAGIEEISPTPAHAIMAADDNTVGQQMFMFKLYNDKMTELKRARNAAQGELMPLTYDQMKEVATKHMMDSFYTMNPTPEQILAYRKANKLTAEKISDTGLSSFITDANISDYIQQNLAGYPIISNPSQKAAWDYAQVMRFQNKPTGGLGELDSFIQKWQERFWAIDTLIPYRRIAINTADATIGPAFRPVLSPIRQGATALWGEISPMMNALMLGKPKGPDIKRLGNALFGQNMTPAQQGKVEAAWTYSAMQAAAFFALYASNNIQGSFTRSKYLDKAEGTVPNSLFGLPVPLAGVIPFLDTLFLWKDLADAVEIARESKYDKAEMGKAFLQVLTGQLIRMTPLATVQRIDYAIFSGKPRALEDLIWQTINGRVNPIVGITRDIERRTGNSKKEFYRDPVLTPHDQDVIGQLPKPLQYTQDNLRETLMSIQPMLAVTTGMLGITSDPRRRKDYLGQRTYLPEGMTPKDHPIGTPGFHYSPVHRELEKLGLLNEPAPLLDGHLQSVPLGSAGQEELNSYYGGLKAGSNDEISKSRFMHGRGLTWAATGRIETPVQTVDGQMAYPTTVTAPTALITLAGRVTAGKNWHDALQTLFRSPEYRALQKDPVTSSYPEVKDRAPADRMRMPGPWLVNAINNFYMDKAADHFNASTTGPAKEWQQMRRISGDKTVKEAIRQAQRATQLVTPPR